MTKIIEIKSRQVFDSRGFPTVQSNVKLEDGSIGTSIVPSGASTGSYEACELRDENSKYLNKSVFNAVENVNNLINNHLKGKDSLDQENIDELLINLDGTDNKSKLGANSILSVSIANCKAAAQSQKKEIFEYLSKDKKYKLPFPLMNIINGGAHANNSLNIQQNQFYPDTLVQLHEGHKWLLNHFEKKIGNVRTHQLKNYLLCLVFHIVNKKGGSL